MKVILVNGSPHKNGSTARALEEVEKTLIEEGIETEIFWIGNSAISGCIGCYSCAKIGKCVIDDVVNKFVEKAETADGFVFGTSVHYAAMTGAMTSFMDRVFYSAGCGGKNKIFRRKPAASVIVARRAGTTATYDQMNKYFGITQMPIISSRYWNMVHGREAADLEKDEEGLQTMRILARNMAYFLKCIESGKQNGVEEPKSEKTILTNFVK